MFFSQYNVSLNLYRASFSKKVNKWAVLEASYKNKLSKEEKELPSENIKSLLKTGVAKGNPASQPPFFETRAAVWGITPNCSPCSLRDHW
jgi:hypothetical protein